LRELTDSPNSASKIAKTLRMDLGVVSYHLNQVLAKQCGVVELVDTIPRRGSVEKIYELKIATPSDLPDAGEPGSLDEAQWTMALAGTLFEASRGDSSRG
jgi:hypothetical protein